jgi:DNA-binding MarR family transcriptional regulator
MDLHERQTWLAFLAVAQGVVPQLDAHHKRRFGVSHIEFSVLLILGDAPDGSSEIAALARRLESSLSRMSHTVRRLRDDGYVALAPSRKDRRATIASLTAEGDELLARASGPARDEMRRLLLDPLTAEQRERLRRVSLKLLASWHPGEPHPWAP